MDPQAALYDILSYLEGDDREDWRHEICDCLDSLSDWIAKGGFLPRVKSNGFECFDVSKIS